MIKLLQNEFMKLFFRRGILISLALFVLLVIGGDIIVKKVDGVFTDQSSWKQTVINEIRDLQTQLDSSSELSTENRTMLQNEIKVKEYYLAHEWNPQAESLWKGISNSLFFSSMITLFLVVIASGIMVKEFEWGTIKLLMTRPATRTKVFLSKYVTLLLTAVGLYVLFLVVSFMTFLILYGTANIGQPVVSIGSTGDIQLVPQIVPILQACGYKLVETVVLLTLAFSLSILFGNSSAAIVISMVLSVSGGPLSFFALTYPWLKYYLFLHTDLSVYANGGTSILPGVTLPFSVTILVIYLLAFLMLAWYLFYKRDLSTK